MSNLSLNVNRVLAANEDTLIVNWEYRKETSESLSTVNVVISAFVTTMTRLKLYSHLEELEEFCITIRTR